jgi:hypothetical protein
MKRDENVMHVDIAPDALVEILNSREYHDERERSKGALSVRYEEKESTEERHVFEVHTETYAKGITGIDRSKRERQHQRYVWDLGARKGSWTFHSSHGEKVKVWGSIRVEEEGDGSRMTNDFNIDVRIPIVGGQVEKTVMKEVKKGWSQLEATVRDFAKQY